ncbi:MAG: hypothetical protein U9Q66_02985 [Patescibacteria group bacterium]|nr:hypothetical protein [Patescibacteria group bacterium]
MADSKTINFEFNQPTDYSVNNFNIEYYTIVDKFSSLDKDI